MWWHRANVGLPTFERRRADLGYARGCFLREEVSDEDNLGRDDIVQMKWSCSLDSPEVPEPRHISLSVLAVDLL